MIGYEVMGRVFHATFERDKQIPFYVPSVYGTLAGAAGCARLLGLSPELTNYALGLAAAFTGGTFQGHEEGAWQRSLNGGMAGERAVTAAQLAATGFRATELGLEGVQGFARMYTNGHLEPSVLFDGLGDSFVIMDRWVKRYPMNTTLHAPVEALLEVMREQRSPSYRYRADRRRVAKRRAVPREADRLVRGQRAGEPAVRAGGRRGARQGGRRRVHRRDGQPIR